MTPRATPPFRAEHVGSLIRPAALIGARDAWLKGRFDAAELARVEDRCIRDAVALQERAGLQGVSDGEFRRDSWRDGFFNNVEGFSADRDQADFEFSLADGTRRKAAPVPRVVGKLKRRRGIATGEFQFLQSVATAMPKITLPAPSVMHFFRGAAAIGRSIYADVREFMADVSAIYREELADLARLGCRYVQFDEVALPILCDPDVADLIRRRGEEPRETIQLYIDALNDALRDRPKGMTVCVHMCRGNVDNGIASGGYEPIAEQAFATLNVDGFLLEYDTSRAGGFEPLRMVPRDKTVALGLVSTKRAEIEPVDMLRARIDEAGRYLPLDQLCLCPQCGFASGFRTARLTLDDEERKLAHLVAVARSVWG